MDGSGPHALGTVFQWAVVDRVTGRRAPNKDTFVTPSVENDGALLRSNKDVPLATWIGHASWVVQLAGVTAVVDPVWVDAIGGVVPRNVAPGVALQQLPKVDVVLVTHNHRDHMDAPSLKKLSGAGLAVVPVGLGAAMKRLGYANVVELEWWASTRVRDLTITLVPSQHWSRRGLADTNDTLWGGFVLEGDGKRVYHTGDTAYFDGFKAIRERLGIMDVSLLPIGAYAPGWFMRKQHMDPADALQAALDLDTRHVLPMHWGTFQLTDEWLGEPPEKFRQLASSNITMANRFTMLPVGGAHRF